jgi:hypothetical protein
MASIGQSLFRARCPCPGCYEELQSLGASPEDRAHWTIRAVRDTNHSSPSPPIAQTQRYVNRRHPKAVLTPHFTNSSSNSGATSGRRQPPLFHRPRDDEKPISRLHSGQVASGEKNNNVDIGTLFVCVPRSREGVFREATMQDSLGQPEDDPFQHYLRISTDLGVHVFDVYFTCMFHRSELFDTAHTFPECLETFYHSGEKSRPLHGVSVKLFIPLVPGRNAVLDLPPSHPYRVLNENVNSLLFADRVCPLFRNLVMRGIAQKIRERMLYCPPQSA